MNQLIKCCLQTRVVIEGHLLVGALDDRCLVKWFVSRVYVFLDYSDYWDYYTTLDWDCDCWTGDSPSIILGMFLLSPLCFSGQRRILV